MSTRDPAASSSPAAQANSTPSSRRSSATIVRTAVEVVAGRVPVYAGAGGSVAQAKLFATVRQGRNGADGLLLLPPVPRRDAAGRPRRLHPRGRRRHRPAGHRLQPQQRPLHRGVRDRGREDPQRHRVQGRHRRSRQGRPHRPRGHRRLVGKDFLFFNGMPTAETTQQAYRAIGVPLYSSATFAFAPDLALAFYNALESGNDELADALLRRPSSTRWCGCATRCPATPSRSSRPASRSRASPPGRSAPPLIMPTADDLTELHVDHRRRPGSARRRAHRGAYSRWRRARFASPAPASPRSRSSTRRC